MIIVAPRVTRDSAGSFITLRFWVFALPVIECQNNDGPRARQNFLWITAFFFAALQVAHFPGRTFPQPIAKLIGMGRDSAISDTARIESTVAGTHNEILLQFRARHPRRHV